jgi:hypothetical protein
MRERLGTIAACLLFAVLFGGIGAFTGYLAGSTVYDGWRARDWIKVRAEAISEDAYRYVYDGRSRVGTRLGLMRIGSDGVDDWTAGIAEELARARAENRPILVHVNPDDPDEAVVDRAIHWKFVVAMVPFALGFGGVGVGALWMLARNLFPVPRRGSGGAMGPLATLWLVTFFWNVITFPIAVIAVPEMIDAGEWVGLLVLLFPLVGVLLLWGALAGTWKRLRDRTVPIAATLPRRRRAS